MFRLILVACAAVFFSNTLAFAENTVPERRLTAFKNLDFAGGDIASLFDTSRKECYRACIANSNCKALTYNDNANACFLKSDVVEQVPFVGAFSAIISETPSEIITQAQARKADLLGFLPEADLEQAFDQANRLAERFTASNDSAFDLLATALEASDQSTQRIYTAAALTVDDQAQDWVAYASVLSQKTVGSYDQAMLASINGYLRAEEAGLMVSSLQNLAIALEKLDRGKEVIPALRLAQTIQPNASTASLLERAYRLFGLKITETTVEADTLEPRICVAFDEKLSETANYSDYVKSDVLGLSAEASGSRLCIGGVQHGDRYTFTLREGLPAASGQHLSRSIEQTQYVRDRSANVRFPGRAYVLPATGARALPVVTVNATEVELQLFQMSDRSILRSIQDGYFGKPLYSYTAERFSSTLGPKIWSGTGEVGNELNQDVTTRLPIDEIMGDLKPGVYVMQANIPGVNEYNTPPSSQWFVISDLGVTTMDGVDGFHVFVRGLSDTKAKPGIDVSLISRGNAVLGTAKTDAEGYAFFAPGLAKGTGATAPGMLTVQSGEDFSFLNLGDPEFDLSDRGVTGREPSPPIDVFLTTERGAYRAGETIHAVALARDGKSKALPDLPLTAILSRPDGVEYSRQLMADQGAGGRVFVMPLSGGAPRGTWRLAVYADTKEKALASTGLLVEDFLPERIDVELSLPEGPLKLSEALPQLDVSADYLFGAPGADLPVSGEVILRAAKDLPGFKGYKFGRYDQPFRTTRGGLEGAARTDADGKVSLSLQIPELLEVMQPLQADIQTRVSEGSNRPVERLLTRPLLADTPLIGVRPLFEEAAPYEGTASFELIALSPDLERQAMPVRWTVNRIRTRYQWYSRNRRWDWNPVVTRSRVASGEELISADAPLTVDAPVEWGEYEIKVETVDGTYIATSHKFYAGWYASADARATPDLLEASLDKPNYKPGDTATLRIVPRYAGTALVTVLSNRLVDMKAVEVVEGENLITFPVTDDWGAGVYVTASVMRPMDSEASQNPARSLGLSYAPVDPGDRKLVASFEGPDEAAPRKPMEVALKVDGLKPGDKAYAMIAAVDLGILNLTGFEAPSASGHYFGQRKLGVGLRDVYGNLIDATSGAIGTVRSGGDAPKQASAKAPPPTEELLAYVKAPVTVGEDGYARTSFDLPQFNGTVRLMAVVWSGTAVGEASKDILVRDPVVVTATLPRFLSPGDKSQLLLEIIHATGPTGEMPLSVSANGLTLAGDVPANVTLDNLGKSVITVPIEASEVGIAKVQVNLTTPDGKLLAKTLTVPIQRNDPVVQRQSQFTLAAGGTFTLDENAFAGLAPGTGSAMLAAGPVARLSSPKLLDMLDRYPYGCTEQTTSRAMPLLYLDNVANAMGLEKRKEVSERIAFAIDRVLTNQAASGSFGLWRPYRGDFWLDAYVTDFLSRARALGHDVPEIAFQQALSNLSNQVNASSDFERGGEGLAYAMLVLAREGLANIGDLRYYADIKSNDFSTPLAVAQLGGALAAYGEQKRADAMFHLAQRKLASSSDRKRWRVDYGSTHRDTAAVLTLASEAGSTALSEGPMVDYISSQVSEESYISTQEASWSLLAANSLIQRSVSELSLDGAPVDGPLIKLLEQGANQSTSIENHGSKDTTVTLTTLGVPEEPEPAGGKGYGIERSYYTMDGERINLDTVASGQRFVSVITVTPHTTAKGRLMVNDPLPAGIEIDNPNLMRSGDVKALDWLKRPKGIENSEFRQERFLTAITYADTKPFQLAYIARAIAPGDYHHPAATVEDMYRPTFRARTATGRVVVTP